MFNFQNIYICNVYGCTNTTFALNKIILASLYVADCKSTEILFLNSGFLF